MKHTDEHVYMSRRQWLKAAGFVAAGAVVATSASAGLFDWLTGDKKVSSPSGSDVEPEWSLPTPRVTAVSEVGDITKYSDFASYTNYYEFSTNKNTSNVNARGWKPETGLIDIAGNVVDYDRLVKLLGAPEQRVMKFRCVEGWGGNFVWDGWPLQKVMKALNVDVKAGQHFGFHSTYEEGFSFGPYSEGIQTEFVQSDLLFFATGAYGQPFEGGNGPNFRVVVPFAYGYKTAKSVSAISIHKTPLVPTWTKLNAREYGYLSVVMPNISHPRWSQAKHRVLGGSFGEKEVTMPFNGYEKEVGPIYKELGLYDLVTSRLA